MSKDVSDPAEEWNPARLLAWGSADPMPAPRFVKIGDHGERLVPDAPEWSAVLDTRTNLMWSVEVLPRMSWKDALAAPAKLTTAGFTDWRLPTVEELFCLADRTRYDPSIDTDFFPGTPPEWFWSSTVDASSPDCAWAVHFGYGSSEWSYQDFKCPVRAVRSGAAA